MKVESIRTNYLSKTNNVHQKQPNFNARLFTTTDLSEAFVHMGGDFSWFVLNMKVLAARLKYLPDKPIMVALSEEASKLLKAGSKPNEPAAEVFVGRPLGGTYNTIESKKIPVNLYSRFLGEDIFQAAKELTL